MTTTIKPVESLHADPGRTPCLTILFHPDYERIGQVARFEHDTSRLELARESVLFAEPGGGRAAPLADPHVSRTPLTIDRMDDGGLRIQPCAGVMDVRLGDRALTVATTIDTGQLEHGVALELAKRVVLLLHRVGPVQQRPPDLGFVGANEAVDELRRNVLRVADMPVPVLIRGETGTGKELLAHAVHRASARADRPFVSVNMAAIPPQTAASELFGHRKGAFTGAVSDHAGYFDRADGGTLFLDEIGATPPDIQPMLLRALEAREIQPMGSGGTRQVDVRLVAATDADLEQAISDESFRAALLHRLEGYQLFLPPLRRRRDDIGRLLLHFLRTELATTGELHRLAPRDPSRQPWLPASLVTRLAQLDWSGNVRQLRNMVRQLAISSRGSERVRVDSALSRLLEVAATTTEDASAASAPDTDGPGEDELIGALRANAWQPSKAAAQLGISRSSMYDRMNKSTRIRQAKDIGRDELIAARADCGGDIAAMAARLEVSTRALKLRLNKLGLSG